MVILMIIYTVYSRIRRAEEKKEEFEIWFLLFIGSVISLSAMGLVQTYWPISKHVAEREQEVARSRSVSVSISRERSTPNGMDKAGVPSRSSANIILDLEIIDVIQEKQGFESFMDHLAKEFSIENLLGIIEFTQYKKLRCSLGMDAVSSMSSIHCHFQALCF